MPEFAIPIFLQNRLALFVIVTLVVAGLAFLIVRATRSHPSRGGEFSETYDVQLEEIRRKKRGKD